ncbi:MAG: hypothetical protein Q9160_003035 [Pyrenula sp. 1 TL-2023]
MLDMFVWIVFFHWIQSSAAQSTFDYIIIGGGTSGLAVANRLSERANITVAVIEPGGDQRYNPNVTSVDGFTSAFNTSIDWSYRSAPQGSAGNRELTYYAGKALGGTSTINGMTYIRGEVAQFDAWEAIGNQGWNWINLLPYYRKSEAFYPPTLAQQEAGSSYIAECHGFGGPVTVGNPYDLANGSFFDVALSSWQRLGQPENLDLNSGHVQGFATWPQTLNRTANVRQDAARAYYYPIENRPNLVVIRGTANKILWKEVDCGDPIHAEAVELTEMDGNVKSIRATREVILSAGAFRSPAILELSGVGNPKILSRLGIDIQLSNPAVGESLQDQPANLFTYQLTNETGIEGFTPWANFATANDLFGDQTSEIANYTRHQLHSWAVRVANSSDGAVNATALEYLFRVQHNLIFRQNVPCVEMLLDVTHNASLTPFWNLLPFSRGSVHIASTDPLSYPIIDPNFLSLDWETDIQAAIARTIRKFWGTQPIRNYGVVETSPGLSVVPLNATDSQWERYIKSTVSPNYHPLGSASMLPRELGGVVDSNLTVYGTSNVRVVDASVLPFQPSGHLTSTLYAVAERISDVIKDTW